MPRFVSPRLVVTAIVVSAAVVSAWPPDSDQARRARVEAGLLPPVLIAGRSQAAMRLQDRMAHYKVPAASAAVIDDGRLVWAHAWGISDSDTHAAVTIETMFQAASISKPVAALVAMSLVRRGALALDDDANARLKSWRLAAEPEVKGLPTIRHLLTHTGGTTVHGFRGYDRTEKLPTVAQVLDGVPPSNSARIIVNLPPGEQFRYSGGGFTVLQQLIEDVSGRPFAELARTAVLNPLDMLHSTYEQPLPAALHARAAAGHRNDGQPMAGKWGIHPEMAAAGLWTTPSDLAKVALEVQRAMTKGSTRILTAELAMQMLTRFKDNQGLGFGVHGEGNALRFSHGGSNRGYRCQFVAYATAGKGAIVMTNGDGGGELANELLRAIAKEYGWQDYLPRERTTVTLPPETLEKYAGQYEFDRFPGRFLTIAVSSGRLTGRIGDGPPLEILAETETRHVMMNGWNLTFVIGADGRAQEIQLDTGKAVRVKP